MKKILKHIIYISCLVILLVLPFFVFAATQPLKALEKVAVEGGYAGGVNEFTLSVFIGKVIYTFLSLLGVVFITLMLYGGFKWMKASGRADEVEKAQDIIRQAIIGLIIVTSSWAITNFVVSKMID